MNEETQRPEWAPAEASAEFASRIIQGKLGDDRPPDRLTPVPKRRSLTIDDYVNGVHASDRTILARAITLVESDSERHIEMAQEMLRRLLPRHRKFHSHWNYWSSWLGEKHIYRSIRMSS